MSHPGPKRLARNFLLDPQLQLKFSAYAVASALAVAALLGGYLWQATRNVFQQTEVALDARSRAAQMSRELGNATLTNELFAQIDDRAIEEELRASGRAIDAHYESERQAIADQKGQLQRRQRTVMVSLGLALVALVGILAGLAIVVTHRVAGPVFRLRKILQAASGGKLPAPNATLRPKDDLNSLFFDFAVWVKCLREAELLDIESLEQLRGFCAASGSPQIERNIDALLEKKRSRL